MEEEGQQGEGPEGSQQQQDEGKEGREGRWQTQWLMGVGKQTRQRKAVITRTHKTPPPAAITQQTKQSHDWMNQSNQYLQTLHMHTHTHTHTEVDLLCWMVVSQLREELNGCPMRWVEPGVGTA